MATVAGFGLIGFAMSVVGSTKTLVLALVLLLWGVVFVLKLGTKGVVRLSMMAAGATAPLNAVRVTGTLALTDVFLVVAASALACQWLAHAREPVPLPRSFKLGLGLVTIGGVLGTSLATHPVASFVNLSRFGVAAAGPVLLLFCWQPGWDRLRQFGWVWVIGATVSGLRGLVSTGDATGRVSGFATSPNHLAFISTLGAAVALALALSERGWRRAAAITAVTVLCLTVLRAGSRAGLLAISVALAVIVAQNSGAARLRTRRGSYTLVAFGLAVVAVALLMSGRISLGGHNAIARSLGDATATASNQGRAQLLSEGIRRFTDHPLTGAGLEDALQAHNIYVQMAASAGVLGLLGLLVLAVSTVRAGFKARAPGRAGHVAIGFTAGYSGYLVGAVFQNLLWDRYLWLHVAVILWCRELALREPDALQPCE